jgi:hypothetical protein
MFEPIGIFMTVIGIISIISFSFHSKIILSCLGGLLVFSGIIIFGIKINDEWNKSIIFHWGRYKEVKGPGIFYVQPFIENYRQVDIRTKVMDVPPQEIITKDSVTIKIDQSNPLCINCGQIMSKIGSCYSCLNCGESLGSCG